MIAQADVLKIKVPPFDENTFVVTDRAYGASEAASAATNSAAIQAAIDDAVDAGGGIVFVPAGTYKIQPRTALTASGYALRVGGNNVTIRGAGRKATKLTFYVFGGLDPNTSYELVAGAVQRGYGIALGAGVKNFTLEGIELAGMATDGGGYQADPSFPANPANGNGWDITHKAIFAQNDATIDNVRIRDCYIHDWRGEIVYYGGSTMGRMTVEDCELAYTNGDCISVSGQCTYRRNELHHAAFAAIEDVYGGVPETVEDNYVHDCANGIMLSAQLALTKWGPVNVRRNRLNTVTRDGIVVNRPQNINVHDNLLVDCGTQANFRAFNFDATGGVAIQQLSVCRNTVLPLTIATQRGMQLYDAGLGIKDSEVRGNQFLVSTGFGYVLEDFRTVDSSGTFVRLVIQDNRRANGAPSGFVSTAINYVAQWHDEMILATVGFVTVTLPSAIGLLGKRFTVKRKGGAGGNVTVACTGGQTIDGAATQVLATDWDAITVISDNANWQIVAVRAAALGL